MTDLTHYRHLLAQATAAESLAEMAAGIGRIDAEVGRLMAESNSQLKKSLSGLLKTIRCKQEVDAAMVAEMARAEELLNAP